ncbi:MAG: hypothetical protein RL538_791 [Candidatus Parcubacteria bacterium]|jgi:hypothetical protein
MHFQYLLTIASHKILFRRISNLDESRGAQEKSPEAYWMYDEGLFS